MSRYRQFGYDGKRLNENLKPLRRFVRSAFGRPWNDAYAKIQTHVRADSAMQLRMLQHRAESAPERARHAGAGKRTRDITTGTGTAER